MRKTDIMATLLETDRLKRLESSTGADPRFKLRIRHVGSDGIERDGWGRIGHRTLYRVYAHRDVTEDDLKELRESLE